MLFRCAASAGWVNNCSDDLRFIFHTSAVSAKTLRQRRHNRHTETHGRDTLPILIIAMAQKSQRKPASLAELLLLDSHMQAPNIHTINIYIYTIPYGVRACLVMFGRALQFSPSLSISCLDQLSSASRHVLPVCMLLLPCRYFGCYINIIIIGLFGFLASSDRALFGYQTPRRHRKPTNRVRSICF